MVNDLEGEPQAAPSTIAVSPTQVAGGPRWLYPLVVLLSLITVCSLPAVALGVWFVRETAEVSQAGKSPYDATYGVLSSLGPWQPDDLAGTQKYVLAPRWDAISHRLLEMRKQLAATGDGYDVEMTNARTEQAGNVATVTVDVAMVYTVQGKGLFQTTQAMPWTFKTVHVFGLVNGWKVESFTNPEPFCATYC